MKVAHSFEAKSREGAGKGAARALRRENQVPAIVYGAKSEPVKVSLPVKELTLAFRKGSFFNKIVDIKVDGKVLHALPRDVQMHPVTDVIEHADFQQVTPDQTIHVMVPVKISGQDKSPGIKRGGVLNIVRHEIELICQPATIPDFIEINVAGLEIGASVHIESIKLPEKVAAAIKRNFTIVTIAGRKAEEEVVAPTAVAATAEGAAAAAGAAAAPGAAPAAGAAAPAVGAAPAKGAEAKPAAKK